MNVKPIIREQYRKFSSAEGNLHIASEYAIFKLQELIARFKIRNVLEVGLGIGSIAGTILEINKGLNYSGTEKNEFCLSSLERNLQKNYLRLEFYTGLENVPPHKEFDLIIIDGKDANLEEVKKLLSYRAIIAIEGDRSPQQKILQRMFPDSILVHSISTRKNRSISPFSDTSWQGGLKIIFVKPDFSQRIWWFHEKISTKVKYIYRNFLSN